MRKYFFGIQKKFLMYSAMLIIIVVLIFAAVISGMIGNGQETIKNQCISVTENMLIKFDSFYKKMDDMTENIIIDSYVQSVIPRREMSIAEREALEKAIAYNNKDNLFYCFINGFGEVYGNRNIHFNQKEYKNNILCTKMNADYAKLHFVWSGEDVFGMGKNQLYICRNIQSIDKIENKARIYFLAGEEAMEALLPSGNGQEQVYAIFSDEGDICYSRSGAEGDISSQTAACMQQMMAENKVVPKQNAIYLLESADGILCAGHHGATGFTMVTFVSGGNVSRLLRKTIGWVLLILFMGLLASFFVSIYTSRRFSRPIQKIANTMGSFGMQSLNEVIEVNTNTELDHIGNAYNVMVSNIKELLNTIQKKEEEVRRLEMESLLYQINPHFLYNTLDNVYMMARIHKQEQIMDMVDALSGFLRITLSNGKDVICVKEELEHARNYMKIQQIRNSDLFEYEILCKEELYSYRIPKMILQPLIENCIEHGFDDIMEGGKVKIRIWEEGGRLIFEVANNGSVMEEGIVNKMNQLLQHAEMQWETNSSKRRGGYGVGNVARRLKIKYGSSVEMKYIVEEATTICRISFETEALERENG